MTKIITRKIGPPGDDPASLLSIAEIPDPEPPGPHQVQVQVKAFQVHPGDLLNSPAASPGSEVAVAGYEATGVITHVGAEVSEHSPGTRVTFFPRPGAWQQRINVDGAVAVAVPSMMSDDVAAQVLANPLTALRLRRMVEQHVGVGYHAVVLNSAAASSVGRLFTAIAARSGIDTIGIVRSQDRVEELSRRFPTVPVISTERRGWVDDVVAAAGDRPIQAAIDPVGGPLATTLLSLLAPGGSLTIYGQLDPAEMPMRAASVLAGGVSLRGMTIGRWLADASREQRTAEIAAALEIGHRLTAEFDVAEVYPARRIADAARHALRPGKVGNVLVEF